MKKQKQSCKVTSENEDGNLLIVDIDNDLQKETLDIKVTGKPDDLKGHKGFHCTIAHILVEALQREGESADKIEVN